MKCPNCGAEIGANSKFCESCGSQISYDMRREQEQLNKQGCPQCGSSNIQFKRENQGEIRGKNAKRVIHRTVGFCKDCGYTWYPSGANSAPQKNNTVWWVLGWIFFFPAPVMVLIWRKKNTWDIKIKIGVTVAFWVLIFALGSCSNNSDTSTAETTAQEVEETAVAEKNEQANADDKSNDIVVKQTNDKSNIQEDNQTANSDEMTDTINNSSSENDMEIINRVGHPTYYGSVEQSHKIWDDIEKGKIHFADKNYGYNDKPILTMDCYRNEDIIRGVYINFTNFEEIPELSVDDTLPIVASYMPYDVMDKWYEYRTSEMIVPDDTSSDKETVYLISYRLTDDGSDAYYAKEHSYSGTIDVMISTKNNVVQSVNITFGTPRWMSSLSNNGYHTEEWNCNLYDYR